MRRYLRFYILFTLLLVGLPLTLILLVDPLWYLGGNRLIPERNFAFNERLTKTITFLHRLSAYDCVLLGSSRTTLIHTSDIPGYHCFNLAFSGGAIQEFLAYAGYLQRLGFRPKLVIVGVDLGNFLPSMEKPEIPAFILEHRSPPNILASYLSWNSLDFAIRTLRNKTPMDRYYDGRLEAVVHESAPSYQPPVCHHSQPSSLTLTQAELYRQLLRYFPGAHTIGYVPPQSAWTFAGMELNGLLRDYATVMKQVSNYFDEFYDYYIPNPITADPANTYDGSHYYTHANREIIQAMLQGQPGPGLTVHQLSVEEYLQRLTQASSDFRVRTGFSACPVLNAQEQAKDKQ